MLQDSMVAADEVFRKLLREMPSPTSWMALGSALRRVSDSGYASLEASLEDGLRQWPPSVRAAGIEPYDWGPGWHWSLDAKTLRWVRRLCVGCDVDWPAQTFDLDLSRLEIVDAVPDQLRERDPSPDVLRHVLDQAANVRVVNFYRRGGRPRDAHGGRWKDYWSSLTASDALLRMPEITVFRADDIAFRLLIPGAIDPVRLEIIQCDLADRQMASVKLGTQLQRLSLRQNLLGREGLRSLLVDPQTSRLKHLDLSGNQPVDVLKLVEDVGASFQWEALEVCGYPDLELLSRLRADGRLGALRELGLREIGIDEWFSFDCPIEAWASNLARLDLRENLEAAPFVQRLISHDWSSPIDVQVDAAVAMQLHSLPPEDGNLRITCPARVEDFERIVV